MSTRWSSSGGRSAPSTGWATCSPTSGGCVLSSHVPDGATTLDRIWKMVESARSRGTSDMQQADPAASPRPWKSAARVRVHGRALPLRPPSAREGPQPRQRNGGTCRLDERVAEAVEPTPHAVEVGPAVLMIVWRVHAASAADVSAHGPAVQVGQSFHDLGEREPLLPFVAQPPRCVEHLLVDRFVAAGQGTPCVLFAAPILQVDVVGRRRAITVAGWMPARARGLTRREPRAGISRGRPLPAVTRHSRSADTAGVCPKTTTHAVTSRCPRIRGSERRRLSRSASSCRDREAAGSERRQRAVCA